MLKTNLSVAFYEPTDDFKAIREHVAVQEDANSGLVAVFGSSDYRNAKQFTESLADAVVFAAGWEALTFVRKVAASDHPLAKEAQDMLGLLIEKFSGIYSMADPASNPAVVGMGIAKCNMSQFMIDAIELILKRTEILKGS
jgi:hypothetical protein